MRARAATCCGGVLGGERTVEPRNVVLFAGAYGPKGCDTAAMLSGREPSSEGYNENALTRLVGFETRGVSGHTSGPAAAERAGTEASSREGGRAGGGSGSYLAGVGKGLCVKRKRGGVRWVLDPQGTCCP